MDDQFRFDGPCCPGLRRALWKFTFNLSSDLSIPFALSKLTEADTSCPTRQRHAKDLGPYRSRAMLLDLPSRTCRLLEMTIRTMISDLYSCRTELERMGTPRRRRRRPVRITAGPLNL